MTQYGVDTNVFIEAKNRYYRFDMPPGRWFWGLMDRAIAAGIVQSAERMKDELTPARGRALSMGEWIWRLAVDTTRWGDP